MSGGLTSLLVAAAFPLGDVLLFFGLMSLVVRRRSLPRDASIAALAAALVIQLMVDLLISHSTLTGSGNIALLNAMAAVSWTLVAWAGYERLRHKSAGRRAPREIQIPGLFAYLVAYVAALAGFGVLLLAAGDILHTPLGVMILAAVAVTPLLLARQVIALRESGTLHELKGSLRDRGALPVPRHQLIRHHLRDRRVDHDPLRHAVGAERPRLRRRTSSGRRRLRDMVHPDDLQPMLDARLALRRRSRAAACAASGASATTRAPGTSPRR